MEQHNGNWNELLIPCIYQYMVLVTDNR